jgi:hypothetical protein
MSRLKRFVTFNAVAGLWLLCGGCGHIATVSDGGTSDAGTSDAGASDAGSSDAGASDGGDPIPTTDEPQYLDFLLSADPFDQTGPGAGDAGAIFRVLDTSVADLVARIGATGDGRTRQLGFMVVVPPWLLDVAFPGKIATVVSECARVALAEHVAFHLSIESHYSWQTRPDLWNFFDPSQPGYNPANVANVEWTDWSQAGYRWRFVDWGAPQNLGAPHMCYLSTAVQSEVARLGGLVGSATRAAMDVLAEAGHPELFSGITVDSEPSLDNYTDVDVLDPALGELMTDAGAPKVRLGYCAFTALGYSAANPTPDAGATAAIANQIFIQSWASAVAGAGVPTNRLYTHIAASPEGLSLGFANAPISIAFVDAARPGWTTYPVGSLATNFQPLLTALAAHGNPHWGGTEAAPFTPAGAVDAYEYLREHYAAGATVVVMNTGATGSLGSVLENAVYGPQAIVAYQRFLAGK